MDYIEPVGRKNHDVKQIVVHTIEGIVLGMIMDKVNEKLDEKVPVLRKNRYISVLVKIFIIAYVYHYMHKYVSTDYGPDWHGTVPGAFFVAIFFAVQGNLLTDLIEIQKKIEI